MSKLEINSDRMKITRDAIKSRPEYSITRWVIENITKEIDTSGRSNKLSCPFHGSDSKPSFSIVEDEGYFVCFGCQKKGDIIRLMAYVEEKETGRLPRDFMIIEKLLATDAKLRLDLGFASIMDSRKESYEEIIRKPIPRFTPKEKVVLHSLLELSTWMKANERDNLDDIRLAVVYAQKGLEAESVKQLLLGEILTDRIVKDHSHINLSDLGIDLEELTME